MGNSRFKVVAWLLVACLLVPAVTCGTDRSKDKQFAQPDLDEALVYLIREKRFTGAATTMYVFSDQTMMGALDSNTYTFAYLPPGKHLLWLTPKINTEVEFEAGKTYYFTVWASLDALDEATGKTYIAAVSNYATPTPRDVEKGAKYMAKLYDKVVASTAARTDDGPKAFDLSRRTAHVAQWPKSDLTAYTTLCLEPITMVNPKAAVAQQQYLFDSAPERIANLVLTDVGTDAFAAVCKDASCGNAADTVVLRARITLYKPGSELVRIIMAGAGSAQIHMTVDLVSAQTGQTLVEFEPKGLWAWGGALGASKGMSDLEQNVAYEVAAYLKLARGQTLPD